jgi:hypothetical protein
MTGLTNYISLQLISVLLWWYDHPMTSATAQANPNLAFIKYWGNGA